MYMGMDGTVYLDETARKKAIRLNPKYAYSVPWHRSFGKIATLLGFSNMSPGAGAFADGVAKWQASMVGLKVDGILGPNTWKIMEPETNFSNGAAALLDPDWLKETPHKARAEKVQGGRENSGLWFGFVLDFGGMLIVPGFNTAYGTLRSADDYQRKFTAEAQRIRLGAGLGGGIGLSFVVVQNLYQIGMLRGHKTDGFDFNVSIGANWAKVGKSIAKSKKALDLAEKIDEIKKSGKKGHELWKAARQASLSASHLDPDQYASAVKRVREISAAEEADGKDGVQVLSFAIPVPGALEISAFYQMEEWYAYDPI